MSFPYKTAIVTGGSSGLGKAFAYGLKSRGVEVYATARNVDRVPDDFRALELDLSDEKSIARFIESVKEEIGVPDLIINNAGFGAYYEWEDFPQAEIDKQLNVLLEGPIRLCKEFVPLMKQKETPTAIVNVSSMAVEYPLPFMPIYNTCKAGLSGFTKSLMMEYVGGNLQVVDFRPGDFKTPFNEVTAKGEMTSEVLKETWKELDKHLQHGPEVSVAVKRLIKTLYTRRSGIVYTGSFFQAGLGPFFSKIISWDWMQFFLRQYYKM